MEDFTPDVPHGFDLDTCDLEPIHTPGTIQPFGVMLAGPADLSKVEYCSANVEEHFGLPTQQILGNPFAELVGKTAAHDLRNLASMSTARTQRERVGK